MDFNKRVDTAPASMINITTGWIIVFSATTN
jgi:hypothetical protein